MNRNTHRDSEGGLEMSDEETMALQDPSEWDFDSAERRPASTSKGSRAVESVAFSREDFTIVCAAAEASGERTSQFIREAALARARGSLSPSVVSSYSGTVGFSFFRTLPSTTSRVSGLVVSQEHKEQISS